MTLIKFKILFLLILLAIYIPIMFFLPTHIANIIFWTIAGWQIGEWVSVLANKLAIKYGYID